ncbi:MAG: ankyrin repeat domain-containing protein [Opitutaceae bacterium]|nr:ankyrin repeat domain-containing protein [Opitutaceae bacterium]
MRRMRRLSLLKLLRGAAAMALLLVPPASQVRAQGGGAPPPSLERLLQAARTGDVAGVARALSSGAPIDGGDPKRGETALMRAAAFGQRATVQALLSAGANPLAESAGKRTALHAAAEGGNVDIIRDLLSKGLPVDGGADRGDTPLTVACAARQPAAIEALVAAGARHEAMGSDCGTLADLIGRSLANDTGSRDLPVIRAFIRARSGLEVAGRVSGTPIQAVVAGCHQTDAPQIARLLIDAGVNLEVKTAAGLTVMDEARRRLQGEPRCAATVAEFDRRIGRR